MIDPLRTGLPENQDAERAVLGAVLEDNRALPLIEATLTEEDFSSPRHRVIFRSMKALHHDHLQIDLVTLAAKLSDTKQLQSVGGLTYVSELNDGLAGIAGIESYLRIVKDKAILRRYIREQKQLLDEALSNGDPRDIITRSLGLAGTLRIESSRARELFQAAQEIIAGDGGLDGFVKRTQGDGIATPWPPISEILRWRKGELTLIASRPSIGKSAAALQIADYAASRGHNVVVFTLEMSNEELALRHLCLRATVDSTRVRNNELTPEERRRLHLAWNDMMQLPIRYNDSAAVTVAGVQSALLQLSAQVLVDLVIVDYLQLMSPSTGRQYGSRTEAVGMISRGLKLVASELNLPLVVLSQLSRAPEHERRRPQLSDLRDSGSLEQDANNVIFLHPPDKNKIYSPVRPVEFMIAKQRNGKVGIFDMIFQATYGRLELATGESDERTGTAVYH